LPSSAFAILGVLIVYITRQRTTPNRSRSIIGGALAGFSFGAAWLCKESTIYFVPFCGILVFWDLFRDWKRYLPLWGGVAAASIVVLGGEMVFYAIATDDLLYRFHASEMTYIKYPEMFFTEGSRFGFSEGASYWKGLAKRLFMSGPEMIFLSPEFLYLPTFGLVASLRGLYFRDSRSYFVTLLFFSLIIMFNFSSVSLESYHPLPLFSRYFYIICVPATVLAAGMLAGLLIPGEVGFDSSHRESLFWGGVMATVILGVTSYGTFRLIRDAKPQWASAEKSLADVIHPDDVVYADPLTRNGLEFFWHYPSHMSVNDVHKLAEAPPCRSYVVVNRNYVDYLKLNHGMWLTLDGFDPPAFIKEPPAEWEKVWKNQWADLYRVSCG
jgi:hypothetical protein